MRLQRNIRLTLAYDGTDFCGFQSQRGTGLVTIQETLENALSKLTGEGIQVEGSGRTDAGVHAWGQVVNFQTSSNIPAERYHLALRPYLPESMTIRDSRQVSPAFHARYDAKDKTYIYQFYCGRKMSPFYGRYAYHVPYGVDLTAMAAAASLFEGSHDFRGFCAAATPAKSFVRQIYECQMAALPVGGGFGSPPLTQVLQPKGRVGGDGQPCLVTLRIRGNGFLWNMVRIIAGTLLQVGAGRRRPEEIPCLLGLGDRRRAGKTLGSQGLFLYEVTYDSQD